MNPVQIWLAEKQANSLLGVLQERWDGGRVLLTQQGDGSLIFADEGQALEITTAGNVFEV